MSEPLDLLEGRFILPEIFQSITFEGKKKKKLSKTLFNCEVWGNYMISVKYVCVLCVHTWTWYYFYEPIFPYPLFSLMNMGKLSSWYEID